MRWCPFQEASKHLPDYNFFFHMDSLCKGFNHPQDLEDWLDENCRTYYCYAWVNWYRQPRDEHHNLRQLVGLPDEDTALALKLMTGTKLYKLRDFTLRKYGSSVGYRLEMICCQD